MSNIREWSKEQINGAMEIAKYLGLNTEDGVLEDDIKNDYYTVNTGTDSRDYVWYLNAEPSHNVIYDLTDKKVIDDAAIISEVFRL